MTPLFKKLNFKNHESVHVFNHPEEFEAELESMRPFTNIKTGFIKKEDIAFMLAFVKTPAGLERILNVLAEQDVADNIVWFAYPKGSSKKYKSEINRDKGWQQLGTMGYEAVRSVAIDNDWSAVRFRRVQFVKSMTRTPDFAMTEQGKQKTSGGRKTKS